MPKATTTALDPAIHRVRLDSLRIFEISEAELEALERGSPESLFLNFGLSVLSVAISFSVALATTKIESTRVYIFFLVLVIIGYLAGILFAVLWLTSRRSLKTTAAKIRARIPSLGIQESLKLPTDS